MIRTTALALLVASTALGVPTQIPYSGYLTDGGIAVTGARNMVFRIFDAETGGAEVWFEPHDAVDVAGGYFSAQLGTSEALDDVVLDGPQFWLEVEVDGTVLLPRVALGSVAYAIRAGAADDAASLEGFVADDFAAGDHTHAMDFASFGSCLPGSSIRGWDATGTPLCEVDDTGTGGGTGDIDAVYAGLGLSGGAMSGDATLAIDYATLSDCTGTDKVVGFSDATGAVICAADVDSGGDITGVTAGSGLSGGGAGPGLVTLSVATGGITSPMILDGAVTTADIANGTILFADWNVNSCVSGDIPKWNAVAAAWQCSADAGTGGDATPDTIADDGVISDDEASDTLTIGVTGTVAWAALALYPAPCGAGTAVTALGDAPTCVAFDSTPDTIADDGTITSGEITDGTVASIDIANGAIVFADWASSGCADTQIPKWNAVASAWQCAADAGAVGSFLAKNATDTSSASVPAAGGSLYAFTQTNTTTATGTRSVLTLTDNVATLGIFDYLIRGTNGATPRFEVTSAGDVSARTLGGSSLWTSTPEGVNLYHSGAVGGGGEVRFRESGAFDYVGFKAPDASTTTMWTLPAGDGAPGNALTTNGFGSLSWSAPDGRGLNGMAVFTSSGTWIVPTGVTAVLIEVWGGGGGGGGGSGAVSGGGGGGGGYGRGVFAVTPGSTIPVTVGAGGPPGGPLCPVGSGGTSSVGALIDAAGGAGGCGADGPCLPSCPTAGAGGAGGTSTAAFNLPGFDGAAGPGAGSPGGPAFGAGRGLARGGAGGGLAPPPSPGDAGRVVISY